MDWPGDESLSGLVGRVAEQTGTLNVGLVRQRFAASGLADVASAVRAEMRRLLGDAQREPAPIAVGVGSRGIANLVEIVAAVLEELARAGYAPFVVPAMGSHGGATPAGQLEVLESYGISEQSLGVEVRATMDTVVIGEVDGAPVHVDRNVAETGRAFLVARVKPHTDFSGPIESGPAKMAAIGLGKQRGARAIHALGLSGLRDSMPMIGQLVAARLLIGALAIVENERDETSSVTALGPEEIGGAGESALLGRARASLGRLPVRDLDVLVVERIGKDISGVGMDPNVIGRFMMTGLAEPSPPLARCIVTLDLSEASHGNGVGIGLADFTSERLARKLDLAKIYLNTMTSGWAALQRARLPMVLPTDRDAILAAAASSGRASHDQLRLAWISDTIHTEVLALSTPLLEEARGRDDLEQLGQPFELPFDASGQLADLEGLADAAYGTSLAR